MKTSTTSVGHVSPTQQITCQASLTLPDRYYCWRIALIILSAIPLATDIT